MILYADIDAFFASVEQALRPELRGRALIVGGGVVGRGVVVSASYEARRFGVKAGMPIFHARRLCPDGVYVGGRFSEYGRFSERIFSIMEGFSPVVERVSLDEACVDLAGCELLHGVWSARPLSRLPFVRVSEGVYGRREGRAVPPQRRVMLPAPLRWLAGVALRLKRMVHGETGLNVSVGIGANRLVAKIASDFCKPDGIALVAPGTEARFLSCRRLGEIPGIGRGIRRKLALWNVHTVEEARRLPPDLMTAAFGPEGGPAILRLLNGFPARTPDPDGPGHPKSMSRETTFWTASNDYEFVESVLFNLTERLGRALRREGLAGRRVQLKLRYQDCAIVQTSRGTDGFVDGDAAIFTVARRLLRGRWSRTGRLRLVGVGLTGLKPVRAFQCPLFDTEAERSRRLDRCLDGLRDRFGFDAVRRGLSINLSEVHAGPVDSAVGGV